VTFSGRLHAQPSIQTMTSAKTIVGSKALCYLLAQFKRHYNYTFSVINKKTPGRKIFPPRASNSRYSVDQVRLPVPRRAAASRSGDGGKPLSPAPLAFNLGTPANSTKNR
jgi:hypothetical protein